jgi:CMP-N-acetylneuraminic acid synthetase
MWSEHFEKVRNFYIGRIRGYHMPRYKSVDIDTKLDLIVAETLLKEMENGNN